MLDIFRWKFCIDFGSVDSIDNYYGELNRQNLLGKTKQKSNTIFGTIIFIIDIKFVQNFLIIEFIKMAWVFCKWNYNLKFRDNF